MTRGASDGACCAQVPVTSGPMEVIESRPAPAKPAAPQTLAAASQKERLSPFSLTGAPSRLCQCTGLLPPRTHAPARRHCIPCALHWSLAARALHGAV